MDLNVNATKKRIISDNHINPQRKYSAMHKSREQEEEEEEKIWSSISDENSIDTDVKTLLGSKVKLVLRKSQEEKLNKPIVETKIISSDDDSSDDKSDDEEEQSKSSKGISTSSCSSSPLSTSPLIKKRKRKSVKMSHNGKIKHRKLNSQGSIRRIPRVTTSSDESSSSSTSLSKNKKPKSSEMTNKIRKEFMPAKETKLNNSLQVTKRSSTLSLSSLSSNSLLFSSSSSSEDETVEASTQTNNSKTVIADEDTEVTKLKKIQLQLKTVENHFKIVVSMIRKVNAFQLIEQEFAIKYKLNLPLKLETEFELFNNNLKLNEEYRNDFIASINPLIDHQLPLTRSLIDIIKRYLSINVMTKFTALRKMPEKLVIKDTEFFKCIQGIACKSFMDRSTMKLISERQFIQEFSKAYNQSKEWETARNVRQTRSLNN